MSAAADLEQATVPDLFPAAKDHKSREQTGARLAACKGARGLEARVPRRKRCFIQMCE